MPGAGAPHDDDVVPGPDAPPASGAPGREAGSDSDPVLRADVLRDAAWTLRRLDPSQDPGEVLARGIPARIPGTVSGALRDALGEDRVAAVLAADGPDTVWEYRTRVNTAGGRYRFVSTGVATVAQLLVADRVVHESHSAFTPWDVVVELSSGPCEIVLRILPTASVSVPRKPRARWLSPLVSDRSLRWRRTPLIGSIDWPGALPVLGPWGGLRALPIPSADDAAPHPSLGLAPRAVRARVAEDGSGVVTVELGPTTGRTPDLGAATERSEGAAPVVANTGGSVDAGVPMEHGAEVGPTRDTVHITVEPPRGVDAESVTIERVVTAADVSSHGIFTVDLTVPDPALWWPHGMGEQPLYRVRVRTGQGECAHTVGFRSVHAEPRGGDHRGLALRVNDVPVFVRGAVWAGADPFEVAADSKRTRDVLERLRAGGSTMIRIPGTACYETEDFHRACDELGLMVWQDVALGPQDPPDDPEWRAGLRGEVRCLAARLASHPSTVVISGGTEVIQAAVLAGRPAEQWRTDVILRDVPRAVGEAGADVVVVPSSPCTDTDLDAAQWVHATELARARRSDAGGHEDSAQERDAVGVPVAGEAAADGYAEQVPGVAAGERAASSSTVPAVAPTDAADGVSHYFGVGAYGRPLEEAVTRGVRFAAEALAFAVPREPAAVREQFGTDGPLDSADAAAAWHAGVAHDPGAEWTFEDTTRIYVHRLFLDRDSDPDAGLAAPARPASEPWAGHAERLEYERATLAHVFQRTFAQWRSGDAPCRGALVLSALSTAPGPGWGVLDSSGRPTAAWYGIHRACAPVAVSFLPAGGDGLPVHVWNDGPSPLTATLRLTVATVRGGCQQPLDIPVTVPARGETVIRADLADGTFRDLDHAYGFGDREYDAVSAQLVEPSGRVLARDVHLTGGPRRNDPLDPGLDARWVRTEQGEWVVAVTASGLARFVALDLPGGGVAEDGYVHVLPGETVHVPVSGVLTDEGRAATRVRVLGVPSVPVNADSG